MKAFRYPFARLLTHAIIGATALAAAVAAAQPALARETPLLMEGKTTLYQRVLTRPGAPRHAEPGGEETGAYPAFQPLYVFARREDWVQVGGAASGPPEGWVRSGSVIDWPQNIVAAFANPAGRERQLMFEDLESLNRLLRHESFAAMAERWREAAETGETPEGSGVVSIEGPEHVDIDSNLYLLPILEPPKEDFHPVTGELFLKMRIASVPLEQPEPEADPEARADALRKAQAGIVLVLDATQSMEPYLAETLSAVRELIDGVRSGPAGDRVNFGVVAFRDDPEAAPGLGWRTRSFAPLDPSAPVEAAADGLAQVRAATVSSPGFNEDSLAAVEDALEGTTWRAEGRPLTARYVILVTDAGPKPPRDPNARSAIDAASLQARAEEMGVAVMTLHLRTPAGQANHSYAERAYRSLSRFGDETYYFPIEGGGREAFGSRIRDTMREFLGHLSDNLEGRLTEVSPEETEEPEGQGGDGPDLDRLGLAMQLAYLGEVLDARAPDVFEAWLSDRALEDPRRTALEPRLLITKNQLSTLTVILREVLETGERTQGSGEAGSFFRQLKGAMARLARDPDMLIDTEFDTLGGAFGEFLEGLPYRSRVMDMTERRWENAGTERRQIIDHLRARLQLYEAWHDDPELWTALYDGAPDGEHVYAMPFEALP